MEIAITVPQICIAVSLLFALLLMVQILSCSCVNSAIEQQLKENKALGIYWSLNLFVQLGNTILASFGFLVLGLYLK